MIHPLYRLPLFAPEGETGSAETTAAAGETAATDTQNNAASTDSAAENLASDGAGEAQAADKAAGADASDDGKAAENAAEVHEEFTLTPPEGMEQFGEDFSAFASEMDGWLKENPDASPREALQEAARQQAQRVSDSQTQAAEAFEKQVNDWGSEAKSDKEIGGEKFDENVATAVKALDSFGSPELRQVLNDSGLGSHPEMIRFAYKVGQKLADPGVVTGATAQQPRNLATSLYGKGN